MHRKLLGGQKRGGQKGGGEGRGHHPIISVDIHPQASAVESILAKSCSGMLGRVLGLVRCEKRNKIIGQM